MQVPVQHYLFQITCGSIMCTGALRFLAPGSAAANGRFSFDHVAEAARKLATEPYRTPAQIPEFLSSLSPTIIATSASIQPSLGGARSGNFQVQFIHPGLYYRHAVKINMVDPERHQFGAILTAAIQLQGRLETDYRRLRGALY